MDPVTLLLRWSHVLAAIIAMGALVFVRFGLLPVLGGLDAATRDRIHDAIRRRWLPWVIGAITVLLASGLANFLIFNGRVREEQWAGGFWMRQTSYHALFGAKFLLAMVAFYFASALVGRGESTQWVRNDRAKWLSVTLGLMLAVVLLSGWMRQLHTGPNQPPDGGVSLDRPAATRTVHDHSRERSDGQERQEAARSAAAEDRQAPAAAGVSQEAAR
jgi:uncharacterized membrane protein